MKNVISIRARFGWVALVAAVVSVYLVSAVPLPAQPLFRISVENTRDHVQTQAVQRFAEQLAERTHGRLRVEFYPEAQLFRDRDVVSALLQGKVEMAVPGTWQLDRYEPAVSVLLLPVFYGREREFVYEQFDGLLGAEITRRLESSTGTVVPGSWIDLGRIHLFTVDTPITRHEDIAGLRIRYAGGLANEKRLAALDARTRLIPWPEFPQRLEQGEVDGVLTSFETVASARLWEAGIRYAFEDAQYFGRYVPMVSERFWRRLPESLRLVIRETWEEQVSAARESAESAQAEARRVLEANGVRIIVPSERSLSEWRRFLVRYQDGIIDELGIDRSLVRLIPEL